MRGRRLSADEVKGLDAGTIILVNRVGENWSNGSKGESLEIISRVGSVEMTEGDGEYDFICTNGMREYMHLEVEYYEYIEGLGYDKQTRGELQKAV